MVFRRNPTPPEIEWKPTPEEWRVYALCDGRRTEEEVVRESGLGEEAYAILAALLKRGLILPVEGPKELCQRLVELLKSRLGPKAEPFVKRLEECPSRESLGGGGPEGGPQGEAHPGQESGGGAGKGGEDPLPLRPP